MTTTRHTVAQLAATCAVALVPALGIPHAVAHRAAGGPLPDVDVGAELEALVESLEDVPGVDLSRRVRHGCRARVATRYSCRSRLRTLPVAVRGSDLRNVTWRGTL